MVKKTDKKGTTILEEKKALIEDEVKEEKLEEVTPKASVKKEAPASKIEKSPKKAVDIVALTKEKLDAEEHTNFIIPMADGEAEGAYDTVQINGYRLTIKKGVMVNIPISVANLLAEKYRINMTAGMEKRADRDNAHSEALG